MEKFGKSNLKENHLKSEEGKKIAKCSHVREIFEIERVDTEQFNDSLGYFKNANKYVIVNFPTEETGQKKNERLNQLCEFSINSEELKFKVNPTPKLKKLPVKVTSSSIPSAKAEHSHKNNFSGRPQETIVYQKVALKNLAQSSISSNNITSYDILVTKKTIAKEVNDNMSSEFVPCINCNNIISVSNIESHSDICVNIKEDVKQVEQSKFTYHLVDFKLKKLMEHLLNLQESAPTKSELMKEIHIIHILLQTVKETISTAKITIASINLLKKLLISIDVSVITK